MKTPSALALAILLLSPLPALAELPSFLRIENSHVRDGNEKLAKGDAKAALADYDQGARELPDAPGLHLDRGLALLKSGELAKARESFLSATQPSAPPALRADAYHNLALAFYREGDQLAGEQKHKEAQQRFREAVDASKRALRLRPGDPNAAWNLELAARRIREEEEKQKEEEQKQKDQQQQDDQQQQQDGEQGDQDQDQQQDRDQQDDQSSQQDKPEDQKPPEPKQDQAKPEPEGPERGEEDQQPPEQPEGQDAQPQLPEEAEQALDALSDSEENFERYRARQRANRERRAPEKDW